MEIDLKKLKSYAYVDDVIDSVRQQFPKNCSCCKREFKDFADFLNSTSIPEHTNSKNIQIIHCNDDAKTDNGDGYILAYRNCSCRSTITLLCAMGDELKKNMFRDMDKDAKTLGVDTETIMELIRNNILAKRT